MMSPLQILYLAPRIPVRPFDGGAHSIYHQLMQLKAHGHHVTLGVSNTSRHAATREAAQELCHQLVMEDVDTAVTARGAALALVRRNEPTRTDLPHCPYTLQRFFSQTLFTRLLEVVSSNAFDVIHVDYLPMAWYALAIQQCIPERTPPIVYRAHNVEYRILEHTSQDVSMNWGKAKYYKLLAQQTKVFETAVAQRVDAVATVSENDAIEFRELAPSVRVVSITPGMDLPVLTDSVKGAHQPPRIGMLGSLEWTPNIEGALWLAREVMPSLRMLNPHVELHLAGRSPTEQVRALHNGSSVIVHGPVDSAAEFLSSLDIALAPVLSGSGIRIKILEGLAHAKPMVSTTLGADGIDVQNGTHLLTADTPDDFAAACNSLLQHPERALGMGLAGRALVEARYSWQAATSSLVDLYSSIALRR